MKTHVTGNKKAATHMGGGPANLLYLQRHKSMSLNPVLKNIISVGNCII
jgi:hypothetical protein